MNVQRSNERRIKRRVFFSKFSEYFYLNNCFTITYNPQIKKSVVENNGRILAGRISKVLDYLKAHKVAQYEIEQRLNYTSLSKAKNFGRYPQVIIEKKTRQELLDLLLSFYGLTYNERLDRVEEFGGPVPTEVESDFLYYVMYYYAFARETIGKAIVSIKNKKTVTIDYPMNEHWEGQFEVIENYTFIQAQKMGDTTPVRKLICLFSGTEKFGRPILLGTYSTVKRDGFPAAGALVFQRADSEKKVEKIIKAEVNPKITHYLLNKVLVSETFTPNSFDSLESDYQLIGKYAGEYLLYHYYQDKVHYSGLFLNIDGSASITIDEVVYSGFFIFLDSHTIKVDLKDASDFSKLIKEEISLIIKTQDSAYSPFWLGNGISNVFDTDEMGFRFLLIHKEQGQKRTEKEIASLLQIK